MIARPFLNKRSVPCDRRVLAVLLQADLMHFQQAFGLEGVTLEDLATGTPQWLKAFFPDIRAGPAARLLQSARDYIEEVRSYVVLWLCAWLVVLRRMRAMCIVRHPSSCLAYDDWQLVVKISKDGKVNTIAGFSYIIFLWGRDTR